MQCCVPAENEADLRSCGIESSYRLITIYRAVADFIEIAGASQVGLTIAGKHSGVDRCCEHRSERF
jgi:hypothetical protein